jgi:hypothetical protein
VNTLQKGVDDDDDDDDDGDDDDDDDDDDDNNNNNVHKPSLCKLNLPLGVMSQAPNAFILRTCLYCALVLS